MLYISLTNASIDGVYEIYNGSHLASIAQQTRLDGTPDNFTTKTVRFIN